MKKMYFISGLGADYRVFCNLKIDLDFQRFIEWVEPEKGESITNYARRLSSQIEPADELYLLGCSFGGIIAQELQRILPVKKIFLVSSLRSSQHIPGFMRFVAKSGIVSIMPVKQMKKANPVTCKLFGAKTTEERNMLGAILADTEKSFLKWATKAIAGWSPPEPSCQIISIHGDKDLILPLNNASDAVIIEGGTHYMIYNRASEISNIINRNLGCKE